MGLLDFLKKPKEGEMLFELEDRGKEKVAILTDIGATQEECVTIPSLYKNKYIVKSMREGAIQDKHNLKVLKVPNGFGFGYENGPVRCENLEKIEVNGGGSRQTCTLNDGKVFVSYGYLSYIIPGFKGSIVDDRNVIRYVSKGVFDGPVEIKKIKFGTEVCEIDFADILAAQPNIIIEIDEKNINYKKEDDVIYKTPINKKRVLAWAGPNGVVSPDPKNPKILTREDLKSMEGLHFKRLEIKYPVEVVDTHAIQKMNCEEIRFSPDITKICTAAVHDCPGVKKIILYPRTSLEESAFYNLPNLESFYFEYPTKVDRMTVDEQGIIFENNKEILYKFPDGRKLDKYVVPDTITKIAPFAFCGAEIKEIEIGPNVRFIEYGAFATAHIDKFVCLGTKAVFRKGSCANMNGPINQFFFDSGVVIEEGAFENTKVEVARFIGLKEWFDSNKVKKAGNESIYESMIAMTNSEIAKAKDYIKK